jgi:hypothetical protein
MTDPIRPSGTRLATPPNGRPSWENILNQLDRSEQRVLAAVKDVKDDVGEVKVDVGENQKAIGRLELKEVQRAQATKDLFRTGNALRTGTLLAVALAGVVLGIYNVLGA